MPEAIIIGGPNGAGKSTLAYELQEEYSYEYLSADKIAAEMNPQDPAAVRVSAGRAFIRRFNELMECGDNFIVESTLSGKVFVRSVEKLTAVSYQTRLAFVFLDSPELCIQRVNERVRKGGHHVPETDIIRRFSRSKATFWHEYRYLVDRWVLYYNSAEGFIEVASGEKVNLEISENRLMDMFMADVEVENE